jgi:diaminopimelate decarboxylase
MASNYNTRPRAAEILVKGDKYDVIRKRETVEELFANESVPNWIAK